MFIACIVPSIVSSIMSSIVSGSVLLTQCKAVRARTMVTTFMAVRVVILMTMAGVARTAGIGMFLEVNLAALISAVTMCLVCGHEMMQLLAVDLGLKALVLVSSVVDSTLVTIGIDQLIVSSHLVAITMFAVLFDIACLVILDTIVEVVFGMGVMVIVMMFVMVVACSLMVVVVRHQVH